MLTRAALLATIIGRGVAPAIPGLAVGIERAIALSGWVSAFLSQIVAAGGVAVAVRWAGSTLRLPKLDLGYRLIALPASAIVVALVMAAWARPLEAELCRTMALSAIAAALVAALSNVRRSETRAVALVLGCASFSGLAHLQARELVGRATERMDMTTFRWAVGVSTLGAVFDLLALGLTVAYLCRLDMKKLALTAGAILIPALALGLFAAHGAAPGVGVARVLLERSLAQLSRGPAAALPIAVRFALTSALLIAAGFCLFSRNARTKAGVVFALCLLSLGASDMPLPALWLVVAALLSAPPVLESTPHVEATHAAAEDRAA